MKKGILFTFLAAAAALLLGWYLHRDLAAEADSRAAFDDVKEAVLAEIDLTPMQEADAQMAKRLYGLDPEEYEGFLLYYPNTNMGAEELLLVKLADGSQRESAAAAMEARLAAQKSGFDGYGAEQTALLNDSVLEVRGNYLLFCAAENADAVRRAFLAAL